MNEKYETFTLTYFLTRTFFLAIGYSSIFRLTKNNSLYAMLLGLIIGIIFLFIYNKFKNKYNFKYIEIIYILYLLIINSYILESFLSSFFLKNTPQILLIIPFLYLCYKLGKSNIKNIKKTSILLFPISISIVIFDIMFLVKYGTLEHFMPIRINFSTNFFKSSLRFAFLTIYPLLLLSDDNINKKINIKSYIISSLILILIAFVIIFVEGPNLITIYRYPEYMVLKKIKIFNFLEKIENFISFIWFFDIFITNSICFYKLKNLTNNSWIYILVASFASVYLFNNYYAIIKIYQYFLPIILFLISLKILNKKLIHKNQ